MFGPGSVLPDPVTLARHAPGVTVGKAHDFCRELLAFDS
jgi:hypothetical protein